MQNMHITFGRLSALRLVQDNLVLVRDGRRFFLHLSLLPANRLEIAGLKFYFYTFVHYNIVSKILIVNKPERFIDFSQFEQDKNFLREKLTNIDPDFSDASEEDIFELLFDSVYSKYSNVEVKEI